MSEASEASQDGSSPSRARSSPQIKDIPEVCFMRITSGLVSAPSCAIAYAHATADPAACSRKTPQPYKATTRRRRQTL